MNLNTTKAARKPLRIRNKFAISKPTSPQEIKPKSFVQPEVKQIESDVSPLGLKKCVLDSSRETSRNNSIEPNLMKPEPEMLSADLKTDLKMFNDLPRGESMMYKTSQGPGGDTSVKLQKTVSFSNVGVLKFSPRKQRGVSFKGITNVKTQQSQQSQSVSDSSREPEVVVCESPKAMEKMPKGKKGKKGKKMKV